MAGWGDTARRSARSLRAVGRFLTVALLLVLTVVGPLASASPLDPAAGRPEPSGTSCVSNSVQVDRPRHRYGVCELGRRAWKRVVLVYGDSLSSQAEPYVEHYFEVRSDFMVASRTFGGTAPCDWLRKVRSDISRYAPVALVFQFSGNLLSPCMSGARDALMPTDGSSPDPEPYYEQYEQDTRAFARMSNARRVPMFISASPPSADFVDASNGWGRLDDLYRSIAADEGAIYMDAPRLAVANPDGSRVETLPCLEIEPCLGRPVAHHNSLYGPDRAHFGCAVPVAPPVRGVTSPCPAHSSGALRFGLAMVETVRAELDGVVFLAPAVPRALHGA